MNTQPSNPFGPAPTSVTIHLLRAAFALLVTAALFYLHDSRVAGLPPFG